MIRPISLAFALAATPALAQPVPLITGDSVDRVAQMARVYGPAERRYDDAEDGPWIRAEMDGVIYTITFLNCTNGRDCSSLQLRAWWESNGTHTIEMMNTWNRDRRFSAAYLDGNNAPTIEFDVNLAHGVTEANFDDTLQWWQTVIGIFAEEVIAATAPRSK